MSSCRLTIETSLSRVDAASWNALAGAQPCLAHAFLCALHDTGCASPATGWSPHYLLLWHDDALAGAVPLYVKSHSRGEYVFDYAWADAYHRHGLRYYPKLLAAVPFTPITGPRLLARNEADRLALARGLVTLTKELKLSSLHLLFPHEADLPALEEAGFMLREGVQFHWRNTGYPDMQAFLDAMSHDKRKKIRQDRKKVQSAGISFRRLRGTQIDDAMLTFFYACYCRTYFEHGNPPYLSDEFFRRVHTKQPDAFVLIVAMRDDQPIACALNFAQSETLYGRYWGAMEFVPGLHFETCYMQSIEYCIEQRIASFEGGAQGEHKIARGLLPSPTWSAHWIADPRFADAIDAFVREESAAMNGYIEELELHTPFKKPAA